MKHRFTISDVSPVESECKMGKFAAYKVNLVSLPEGVHEQDFVCGTDFFKNMECGDVIDSDVAVHLYLQKKGEAYHCRFTLCGMMHIPCDRCLDPMAHPVETEYEVTVKYGDTYADNADGVLEIPYSDTDLNVAYLLYDTLMLTIPMRHVHPSGECNKAMAVALHRHSAVLEDEQEIEFDNVEVADVDD